MKGWVTWASAAGLVIYGVGGYFIGLHESDKMLESILAAGALIGVGRKLDRASV